MMSSREMDRKIEVVSKQFQLTAHSLLGKGAFGFVHRVSFKQDPKGTNYALKSFSRTARPLSIANELRVLRELGGKENIMRSYFAGLDKSSGDIFVLMDYFPQDNFGDFVRTATSEELIDYIRNLLIALEYLHSFNVTHRDVKPANFLFNRKNRQYRLIDFGLAIFLDERKTDTSLPTISSKKKRKITDLENVVRPSPKKRAKLTNNTSSKSAAHKISRKSLSFSAKIEDSEEKPARQVAGKPGSHPLPSRCPCFGRAKICGECVRKKEMKALTGGTSGFRAPEVLLKSRKIGPFVDMWGTGVICLCILSGKYPFLRPDKHSGECLALAELATLFGSERMRLAAQKLGKNWIFMPECPGLNLKRLTFLLRTQNAETSEQRSETTTATAAKCQQCHQFLWAPNVSQCLCLGHICRDWCCSEEEEEEECVKSEDRLCDLPESIFELLYKLLEPDIEFRISAKDALKEYFS